MASYLEIKQLLKEILYIEDDINEECDIIFQTSSYANRQEEIVFHNDELKSAFDRMQDYKKDKLEMSTEYSREVALQFFGQYPRMISDLGQIEDSVNDITYAVEFASVEYCMFILDSIAESVRTNGRRVLIDLRHRSRMGLRRNANIESRNDSLTLIPELLRAYTLKINSLQPVCIKQLREYAASFEFLFMYKQSVAVSEYTTVEDMYAIGNSVLRYSREELNSPPLRIYNLAVLEYYTMAMESRDPFTMYISFYHIIEHYFDAIFRKKLTEEIKDRITHPDFSYKSETKVYELAKYIKKHMNSDDNSGKGNEYDSLKYVLMEYVPVDELKNRIQFLDSNAIAYYQNNFVPFTTSRKTKIAWADEQGVYANMATRIYETRNALVHSKSEQGANQYKPYENRKELVAEIALIKAVAELVLINSSEIL